MSAVTHRAFSRLASLLLATLLIFTAGLISAPSARADETSGSLSGVVTDEAENPVANAYVAAYGYDIDSDSWGFQGNAYTSEDGSYLIEGLAAGDYRVEFATWNTEGSFAPEWWSDATSLDTATTVAVEAASTTGGISPQLAAGSLISGTVTDDDGNPVGGVGVSVYGYDDASGNFDYRGYAYTSEDGTYAVTRLAAGDYKVQFETGGASVNVVGEWWDDAVSQDAATVISVSSGSTMSDISPRLGGAGAVSGTVTDEDGNPVGSVDINVYGHDAESGDWDYRGYAYSSEDGTYTVGGLAAGDYKVQFGTSAATANVLGEWWEDAASQDDAAVISVSAGSTTSDISPRLGEAGALSGTATDDDGNPVGSVRVTVYASNAYDDWDYRGSADTSEDGTYTVAGLAAGDYKIQFETGDATANVVGEWWDDATSQEAATVVSVSAGSTTTGISPRLAEAGAVSGTVTDADGNAVGNVDVSIFGHDAENDEWDYRGHSYTSDDGFYLVRGLAAGAIRVEFTTEYAPANVVGEWWDDADSLDAATDIAVLAGETTADISPQLALAGAVSGTVTDEHGNPAQGVDITAYVEGGGYWSWHSSTVSAEDGTYLLSGLPANDYKLQFTTEYASANLVSEWWDDAADEESGSVVSVTSGLTASGISPRLAAGATITGAVTDKQGSAVSGIPVYVSSADSEDDFSAYGYSDDGGEYAVRGLPAGDYLVRFQGTETLVGEWWDDARDRNDAKAVTVSAGSETSNISPVLAPAGRIAGVVSDESGNPVSGVEVFVDPVGAEPFDGGGRIEATGEDGSYEVPGLSAGEYTVRFSTWDASRSVLGEWWDDAESKSSSSLVRVEEGSTTSGISPQLATGGEISGTVRDGDGHPLKYFGVKAYLGDESVPTSYGQTSKDGSFTIRGLRAGEYKLLFSGKRASKTLVEWWNDAADRPSALPVAVAGGAAVGGIDIVLDEDDASVIDTRTASLSGTVTDEFGQPVKRATVMIADASGRSGDGTHTDASGNWWLGHMPSGDYKVAIRATIGGEIVTQFWDEASDFDNATVIALSPGEQRAGIDSTLRTTPLPVLESSVPSIAGTPRFGDVLSVAPGQWTEGTTFVYQWFADDVPLAGATSASLVLSAAEVGKRISVQVTGAKDGYKSITRTALPTAPVAPLMLTAAMPTISGKAVVGSTVTAKPGAWTEGTAFSYQWFADGAAITGAENATYVIAPTQLGKKLTVRVAGALTSYASVAVMSAATGSVVLPTIAASVPTISGTVAYGSTLTAKPGTWTSGTAFSYQWYANGVKISGATKSTFKLGSAQKAKQVSVTVTGKKSGYATVAKSSAKSLRVATAGTPSISGTRTVGKTLTAKTGTWTSGTSFSFQWYASGKAISKATKSTFKLTSAQRGKTITVKVTGKKSGYPTIAKTSKATAKVK